MIERDLGVDPGVVLRQALPLVVDDLDSGRERAERTARTKQNKERESGRAQQAEMGGAKSAEGGVRESILVRTFFLSKGGGA